ncbi:ABC transporter ATP-binding protein [Heyndrickxia acidiproducens]|uniref:ABC transporter ATP-binding protein n=1 Tax=Heyndrickxia acidiproducens TaxID=1121084 RepID=UPI000364915A|nr:ABC transporter ATP-binding protein [Heyndrickxia acidiproducens]
MAMIEMENVSKSYRKGMDVLRDLHFTVEKGEFFVLVGPSGCGKSSILRMIAGLEEISGGSLYLGGRPANHLLPQERQVSMVFQNYALYPHMTVKDNILFGIGHKKISREEKQKRLTRALELVQLQDYAGRKPRELSGGQRQRVALARAIVSDSPICLMDEPLSNLDAKLRAQMRTEIRRLQRQLGLTLVYVTHDQTEAMTMGDRIMVLNEGKIQQIGKPIELYNHPANLFVASFIGSPQMNVADAAVVHQGGRSDLQLSPGLAVPLSFIPERNHYIIGVRPEALKPKGRAEDLVIHVPVLSVEQLGNETIIGFEVQNRIWKAKWNGQWMVQPEEKIKISISPEDLQCFDPGTHERVTGFFGKKGVITV